MEIPKAYTTKWKLERSRGDLKELEEKTGRARNTILKALAGEADEDLFVQIKSYFEKKQKRIAKITA